MLLDGVGCPLEKVSNYTLRKLGLDGENEPVSTLLVNELDQRTRARSTRLGSLEERHRDVVRFDQVAEQNRDVQESRLS